MMGRWKLRETSGIDGTLSHGIRKLPGMPSNHALIACARMVGGQL